MAKATPKKILKDFTKADGKDDAKLLKKVLKNDSPKKVKTKKK